MSKHVVQVAPEPDRPKLEKSDEILEYYLKNCSYYRQTILSMETALQSVWRKQVKAVGAHETASRLKSFWVNIGLVSALLIGVSYSNAVNPVTAPPVAADSEDDEVDPLITWAISVATTLTGVSVVLSLTTIVVCVIYLIEIDNCTTERDLRDFIFANATIVDLLTGVFSASVVCLLVAALSSMFVTYGRTEFIIVASITGFIALCGAVFAAIVAGHNRFRLWVRYDSPEGKALVDARDDECQAKLAELEESLLFQVQELRLMKEYMELKEAKDQVLKDKQGARQRISAAGTESQKKPAW